MEPPSCDSVSEKCFLSLPNKLIAKKDGKNTALYDKFTETNQLIQISDDLIMQKIQCQSYLIINKSNNFIYL